MRDNFEFNGINLSFCRLGSGSKVLLVFHGFGQDVIFFKFYFDKVSPANYTIYWFDLFYHGEDKRPFHTQPLSKADWLLVMSAFLDHYQIRTFSCIGFSLGCKLIWPLLSVFEAQIDQLWLIAPDGLQRKFWYKFSTKTLLGRYFLKQLLFKKVHFLFSTLDILCKIGAFKVSFTRFIRSQLNTPDKRLRLYYTWMAYCNLETDPFQIIKDLVKHSDKTVFYLAIFDAIFPLKKYSWWKKRLSNIQWETRPVNHTQIFKVALSEIAAKL